MCDTHVKFCERRKDRVRGNEVHGGIESRGAAVASEGEGERKVNLTKC